MHSNIGVWGCKLFSEVMTGWPVNTSRSMSLSHKCSRLFAFLWLCLFTSSPPLYLQQAGPEEDSLQNHKVGVIGLRFLLLSFGNAGKVQKDSLGCGTPSGADSAQCTQESEAVSSSACLGVSSQQNTYLLCHALLLTPLSTASLTWCLKGSYNTHLSLLGGKNSVNAAFE